MFEFWRQNNSPFDYASQEHLKCSANNPPKAKFVKFGQEVRRKCCTAPEIQVCRQTLPAQRKFMIFSMRDRIGRGICRVVVQG